MGNAEVKVIKEVLSSKPRFRRACIIIAIVCATLIAVAYFAFTTGAVKWNV